MCWSDGDIDVLQLSEYISTGHTFVPLSRKKNECWNKYSNVVFIDIDHSDYTLDEHFNSIPYKPTVAYETYSDTPTDHRYRFVYVFDRLYNGKQFHSLLDWIVQENRISKYDKRQLNQYYNGTFDKKVITTGYVYVLPDNLEEETPVIKDGKPNESYKHYFTDETWNMYWELPLVDFRYKCFDIYGTVVPTEKPYVCKGDERIFEQPDNYVKMPIKEVWDTDRKVKVVQQWRDGEMRHKRLYNACMVLMRIEEGITPDKLLYYLVDYFMVYIDNSDCKFNKMDLMDKVVSALNSDISFSLNSRKYPAFRVNRKYCQLNDVKPRTIANKVNAEKCTAKKLERYNEISKYYDATKTNKENIEILKTNGIEISSRTLDNFKKFLKTNV